MRTLHLILLFTSFLQTSCATHGPATTAGKPERKVLFPEGTYRHDVRVRLKHANVDGKTEMHFSGVVVLDSNRVKIIGVSPFGTTLFRLTEERLGRVIKLETEIDAMKKSESKLLEIIRPILSLLTMRLPIPENGDFRVVRSTRDGWPAELESNSGHWIGLENYDASDVPRRARIRHDAYETEIKVEDYAP